MRKKLAIWFGVLLLLVCFVTGCEKSLEEQIAEQLELGQKYLSELNYEEAIVAFTKAIELDEKTEAAYIGLAEAYEGRGDVWQATQTLETGYELFPEEDMKNSLVETYKRALEFFVEDMERQREIYDRLIELFPEDSSIREQLIQFYQKNGDLEELEKLTEMDQSGITDEKLLDHIENIKTALETIEKISNVCEAGEIDQVFGLVQSDEFEVLRQFAGKVGHPICQAENGKGVGIYLIDFFDGCMIYYGDYKDGQRHGYGLWIDGNNEGSYLAEGEWSNDVPNGTQEVWNWWGDESDDSFMYEREKGIVENGLWHGEVWSEVGPYGDNHMYEFLETYEHGKVEVLRVEELNGKVFYVLSDYEGHVSGVSDLIQEELKGIWGFE